MDLRTQRLFFCAALTDWFSQRIQSVFTARYELHIDIVHVYRSLSRVNGRNKELAFLQTGAKCSEVAFHLKPPELQTK